MISHIRNTTGIALCQPDSTVVAAQAIPMLPKIRPNSDELMNATGCSILTCGWPFDVWAPLMQSQVPVTCAENGHIQETAGLQQLLK
jgi:hypothetical protein